MKKTLAMMTAFFAFSAIPAVAMDVDDILELCRAGFEPDRIARIVEAAGMDQPLEAADWSRIKTEGCNEGVIDALLDVLAPVAVEEEYDDRTYDSRRDNVNINLYGNWGTNGWYGSAFWGGYSPWGIGYSSYDPWWDWAWRWHWAGSWNWYDPWWCYPHRPAYYAHGWYSPYYYHGGHYAGHYYSGGVYHRQKASRQGGSAKATRYASGKTSVAATKATYASAKAKPYRDGAAVSGLNESGSVAIRKSTRTSVTTAGGTSVTRSKTTATTRSGVSTGAVKQKGSTVTTPSNSDYAKRKTAVRNGGTTSTGNATTVDRSKTKTRTSTGGTGSTGTSTTVKRKSSGATSTGKAPETTAPTKESSGSTYRAPASTSTPSGTAAPRSGSGGSSGGGTARPKGGAN